MLTACSPLTARNRPALLERPPPPHPHAPLPRLPPFPPPQLPSTEELEAVFSDRKLTTIVFFLDETFEELEYDLTSSVLEAVEQVAGIIKLQVGCGRL